MKNKLSVTLFNLIFYGALCVALILIYISQTKLNKKNIILEDKISELKFQQSYITSSDSINNRFEGKRLAMINMQSAEGGYLNYKNICFQNKVTLVFLFSVYDCHACLNSEIILINNFFKKTNHQNIGVVGIGRAQNIVELTAFKKYNKINYPILYDGSNKLFNSLNIPIHDIPSLYFLVDKNSRILSVNIFDQRNPGNTLNFLERIPRWAD